MKAMKRCGWVKLSNPLYVAYHDREWGVKDFRDERHFEYLILETFQAGLSWEIVLNKREAYRQAMWGFQIKKIANATEAHIQQWLNHPGLIRHEGKLRAAIQNAQIFLSLQKQHGSFHQWIMRYFPDGPICHRPQSPQALKSESIESTMIAKDLKSLGMKFVGSKIIYAHLQAIGIIDDHEVDCEFKPKF